LEPPVPTDSVERLTQTASRTLRSTPGAARLSLSPALLVVAAGLVISPLSAIAQAEAPASATDTGAAAMPAAAAAASPLDATPPAQLLEDFCFYVNIANIELAKANANALVSRLGDPKKFLALIEDSPNMQGRFDESYRRAILNSELEPYAAQLWQLYEEGRRQRARDPQEIEKNIAMLNGNSRARLLASSRLREAKEYAVPSLLATMTESKDAVLRAESQSVLREMGRDAVMPLCASLSGANAVTQEMVARVLGNIQYPSALPYLYELRASTTSAPVKEAATAAITKIAGNSDESGSASEAFRQLGERYLAASPSLTIFQGESHQLAWKNIPGVGINPMAVRSEVAAPTMAMSMAEKALALDPNNTRALSLWLAANFARQLSTPEGYQNPLYPMAGEGDGSAASGPVRRDPMYYAVAAGSGPVQSVLARALDLRDTRLARKAIEALEMNMAAAGFDLGSEVSGGMPLVQALSYPDRRVQFEAAMAIAKANPAKGFDGSERVVPVLAAAVRDAGSRFAAVIARQPEQQQAIRAALEADGYTVIKPAFDLSQAADGLSQVPGVDLMVIELPAEAAAETIDQARQQPRLRATPILAMMSLSDSNRIAQRFSTDALTRFAREGLDEKQIAEASRQLTDKASGPRVTEDEAKAFALAALERLDTLATASNPVLDVGDAASPLIASLPASTGDVRAQIAGVLSRIGKAPAQVALMDAAIGATGEDRVAMLNATARSAKRFGNMLEERQVSRLVELVGGAQDAEATAAAALMGALNLPNTKLVPLITGG
jgi:CheY-like chemotaxis protein